MAFTDYSKFSLKAVFCTIETKKKTSVPLANSVGLFYENIQRVLKYIKYEKHKLLLCTNLKVISLILGLQGGFRKFCCLLPSLFYEQAI